MENKTLKQQFISGALITFVSRYMFIAVNLIISAILARILDPDEFGVVAIVAVFTTFFQMLSQMGLGAAVIQHKTLSDKDISDIFKFTTLLSFGLATAFFFFSYAIAYFYENDVYVLIGKLLSISVLFNSMNIVPTAILTRDKRFKAMGITTILMNLIAGIATIILALHGFSYFSIVINSILLSVLMFSSYFFLCKIKIKKAFSLHVLRQIAGYSAFEYLHNFVNYFSRNIDNILIGKFLGATQLGYYDRAYRLMMYPVMNLTHVLTPVLHPLLADYQDNKDKIYSVYKRLVKFLAMLGVPIVVILFFYAKEIIFIMYGDKWLYIIPTFRILSLSIIIQIITGSGGAIFRAAGRTDVLFLVSLISGVLMVSGISLGVFVGGRLEYVAVGILVAMCINFIQLYYLLIVKVLGNSLIDFYMNLKTPFLIGMILIGVNIAILNLQKIESLILNFFISAVINFAVWLACIFIFKESKFMGINKIISKLSDNRKSIV
ncbi:lipopolysaccharide biosynthesis protein [Geovibrio thiophilus]|uniref:Lipopolysaccharide biosynthesis protein n=1 Tax=Geovibrio thiophilus TaxID=139438 RepID=A0A3R5UW75_9BACT|nr:lipopolysaccharide biosynthesis protein [Geovibrio thiophilus]QAR34187.1 lipopolysaccharide biosynthesis protein [Geovibrio thiophilus]